jgi:subtilisin family serine protease
MRRGRFLMVLATCLSLVMPGVATAVPARGVAAQIDAGLRQALEDQDTARFVVVFDAKAQLGGAERIEDFSERGEFVVDKLQRTAAASQAAALDLVADRGGVASSYWVRNTMVVEGDAELVEALAAVPGVAEIRLERIFPLIDPVKPDQEGEGAAPEWGVEKIAAPAAWDQGVLGGGIVVANIDTGVDYSHPALSYQYRGNLGDGSFSHDYNWFDPTGLCGDEPCDDVGHGTHTMGTMVGGDGPGPFEPDIGVAPGASWIAAKGCEDFGCSESALLGAGQWVLAPTDRAGGNPDPSKRPDIVNNSWGGFPGDPFYLDMVSAWRAAGVVPVFSSGNPGPFCGEGGSPGDYLDAISVGATDIEDVIAEFSGRGPSVYGKINPNVAAPGVDVTSSVPGGGYEAYSGTSMAAPHVAGTLALMMSAEPALIGDVAAVQAALETTAQDIVDLTCGGDDDGDPNNVYGEGRIDAAAAVALVATGGTLEGRLTDTADGSPLAGARVTASNDVRQFSTVADGDGAYRLFLAEGLYTVSASLFGYETVLVSGVEIIADGTTTQNLALTALPRYTITGQVVFAENGAGVPNAVVTAVGTPADPVVANRSGRFRITLPLGSYTLESRQGGCTTPGQVEVDLRRNMQTRIDVTKKIDDFGHGCEPIRTRAADGRNQTALYGDDAYGRLRLPFEFPFYGAGYGEVFVTTNGYLTFEDPFYADFFNTEIPSVSMPNLAIYPLWTDLIVDGTAAVGYAAGGRSPNRWFVVDYQAVRPLGGSQALDITVTLWENGEIDMHYGDFSGAPGDGSTATIGIEAAEGADAFQFSYREATLQPNSGYRYKIVPTGVVSGIVTNANDGLPVSGATITAQPGGRTATTDGDGRYSLRLVPGSYTLVASATDYVDARSTLTIAADETPTVDFSLAAAVAVVEPPEIGATVALGEATTRTVTVSNVGSAPLVFEAKERDQGGTPIELPPAEGPDGERLIRPNLWERWTPPAGSAIPTAAAGVTYDGPLDVVIDDPDDDSLGAVEVTQVLGGSDGVEASVQIDFSDTTPIDQTVGYVFLDTDQDVTTGIPPEALAGLPAQELGVDYFVDLFGVPDMGIAYLVDTDLFEIIAEIPVLVQGQSYRFDLPLEAMGGDDGAIDIGGVLGDFFEPHDWVPDQGKGTIEPFRDAPWMGVDPQFGMVPPGESANVTVTLGGEGIDPGDYAGQLTFVTNDPRTRNHVVDVALTVTLPEGFGVVTGTVTNSRAGFPIPASIEVDSELEGEPYPIVAAADDAGSYRLYGPAGTWPATVTSEGYADFAGQVVIAAGSESTFDVALDPLWPWATLEGAPIEVELAPGESAEVALTLGNADGLAPLSFSVAELADIVDQIAAAEATTSNEAPAGYAARAVEPAVDGGRVLVLMDELPWGVDSLTAVLDLMGITYDMAGSGELPGLDLAGYEVVFVSNDQPQRFYDVLADQVGALEGYVNGGGYLWLGVAGWGWNGGEPDGLPLPGGGSVSGPDLWESNEVTAPDHPIAVGLPSPFFGQYASHSTIAGHPDGTVIAVTPVGDTTLVEYDLGSGRVLVLAQPVEWGWAFGEDSGIILANGVPVAVGFEPFTDVEWVSVSPTEGVVPVGETTSLVATLDASTLEPGTYGATIVVLTDDPLSSRLYVPVMLTVTEP